MKTVDIIIPLYNQLLYTIKTIESIEKYTENYNLILIDNDSIDGTKEWIDCHKKDNWTIIKNQSNLGYIKAINQGLKISTNDVVLMNNDVIVTENWLYKLQLHSNEFDIIAPITNNASGKQKDLKALYNDEITMQIYAKSCENRNIIDFPRVIFFCVFIKRDVINEVGYLDEIYGLGNYDDDDYCIRSIAKGYRIGIAQNVFIHHFGSVTFKDFDYSGILNENKKKFFDKWNGTKEFDIYNNLIKSKL